MDEASPFDPTIHFKSAPITEQIALQITSIRKDLESEENYINYNQHQKWCTDQTIHRFLIARQYDEKAAMELIREALKWRVSRIPLDTEGHLLERWGEAVKVEGETGKIYIPGFDRWGRPLLIFDNTVQNTASYDGQMSFLAWNLECACRLMPANRDKYTVFMHLTDFSLWNAPPFQATKETIFMLCNSFPECLGHVVAFGPPSYFKIFFNLVKFMIDPRTVSKLLIITGDVTDGSENDKQLRSVIGDNWRQLCGVGGQVFKTGNSPGYRHEVYWPFAMKRAEALDKGLSFEEAVNFHDAEVADETQLHEEAS